MPPLLEKFSDSKILVRAANMKVLRRLMGAVSPAAVLGLLGAGAAHSSWRVREEVLNAHIMVRGLSGLEPAGTQTLTQPHNSWQCLERCRASDNLTSPANPTPIAAVSPFLSRLLSRPS